MCAMTTPRAAVRRHRVRLALLNLPPPPEVPFEQADLSPMARGFYDDNKRVSNSRIKRELGVALQYPSYRVGLPAILSAGG